MEYPRPDFHRPSLPWTSLNGPWSFHFDPPSSPPSSSSSPSPSSSWPQSGLPETKSTIKVPYTFQTPASGINLQQAHETIWYERSIPDIRSETDKQRGNRLLLRFGAVDYECWIWVEGVLVKHHRGGQVGFDVDVSDVFASASAFPTAEAKEKGEEEEEEEEGGRRVTIKIRDSPTDLGQPRGKQYWGPVPESIFYTPSSGIWGDVWVESVPAVRISEGTVLRGEDVQGGQMGARVVVEGRPAGGGSGSGGYEVQVEARLKGVLIGTAAGQMVRDKEFVDVAVDMKCEDRGRFDGDDDGLFQAKGCWGDNGVALWAPEHPILYDVSIRLSYSGRVVDEVQMAMGMRNLDWRRGDGTFRLNGEPLFQALVLDQGYWPETGLTPPSQEALKADIIMSKKMGFNGCRKHQKVEHPAFLYWADRLGYLVWGEIGNAYEFNAEYVERFNEEWTAVVRRDLNHPCIVTWTPVNESWGYKSLQENIDHRNHIRSLYYMTKTLDPTRPINDNCGWEHVLTDLTTYHDYSDSAELAATCSKLEGGILGRKLHGEMFTGPIYSGSTLLDPGAQHTPGAPVICSEFGGVNIAPAKDAAVGERDWGYTTAADPTDLLKRLERLMMAVVQGGHSCGFVYTQLCDIEQEVNGLYSYDRREKVPAARVKAIIDAAREYYHQKVLP